MAGQSARASAAALASSFASVTMAVAPARRAVSYSARARPSRRASDDGRGPLTCDGQCRSGNVTRVGAMSMRSTIARASSRAPSSTRRAASMRATATSARGAGSGSDTVVTPSRDGRMPLAGHEARRVAHGGDDIDVGAAGGQSEGVGAHLALAARAGPAPRRHDEQDARAAHARSTLSSALFASVLSSRYLTMTGAEMCRPRSLPQADDTGRLPGTTTAPAGISRGASSVPV